MSGIAGLFYLDDRPIDRVDLARMTDILAHRGPDDGGIWYQGPVGLGHRMLWTTPESLHEKLPLANPHGDMVITADARLDNRDELLPLLGFSDRPAGEVTDSQLILLAYEKWGEQCPEKLMGDFAFVIWDERQQILFCARDHFGIRPLYYYHSGRLFVFGSEIKALLVLSEVPRRLNELKVGYHLALTVEDKAITFYQNIFRLLPAHSMSVSRQGVRLRKYWSLDPSWEIRLSSDEAYAEAFLEIFTEAVKSRLRSAYPLGMMLSGGLDSSAIAAVTKKLITENGHISMQTFSAVYEQTTQCDERHYINIITEQSEFQAHFVDIDMENPFQYLESFISFWDEPFTAPSFYLSWTLNQVAQRQGIRVILDGLDGDTTVGHGDGYLAELARSSQWQVFFREAELIARHENLPSVKYFFWQYGLPYIDELRKSQQWLKLSKEIGNIATVTSTSPRKLWRNHVIKPMVPTGLKKSWRRLRKLNGNVPAHPESIISSLFSKRIALEDNLKSLGIDQISSPKTSREDHYNLLAAGLTPYVFELSDRSAMAFSMEARHPFADKRLIEFSLALPSEQKLKDGWTRMIMRQGLKGILPEEIRWRGGKTRNSPAITRGIRYYGQQVMDDIFIQNSEILEDYVDIGQLQTVYRRYLSHGLLGDEILVWQALVLSLWLKHQPN